MKRLFIIFFSILIIHPVLNGQQIQIKNIKKYYYLNDKVDVIVSNNTNKEMHFTVVSEINVSGNWEGLDHDILMPESKVVSISPIKAKGDKIIHYKIYNYYKSLLNENKEVKLRFKLKFTYNNMSQLKKGILNMDQIDSETLLIIKR